MALRQVGARCADLPGFHKENHIIKPILFSSGDILATPGALGLGVDLMPYLFRHLSGDWGDVDEFAKQQNDLLAAG